MQATKSVKRNHRKSEVVLLTILEYFIRKFLHAGDATWQ